MIRRLIGARATACALLAVVVALAASDTAIADNNNVTNRYPQTVNQQLTATPTALPNVPLDQGLLCKARDTNTGVVWFGGPTLTNSTGLPVYPGAYAPGFAVPNANFVYVYDTVTTDYVDCVGN